MQVRSRVLPLLAFLASFVAPLSPKAAIHATNLIYPGTQWAQSSPAEQGLDPEKLSQAIDYLKSHSGSDGARELLFVRNGRVVWQGDHVTKVHGIWSGTKSFVSTCLGLLSDRGLCELNTLASTALPSLSESFPDVTLRHFTTMTSGYRAKGDEPRGNYTHGPSRTPFVPSSEALFATGTHYAYWDSAMNQFANVLTRITERPLEKLFADGIADPIGMHPDRWRWGAFEEDTRINGGAGNNGKGIFISATELARLGWLFLNHGRWNGQQLISSNWVHQATSIQVPAAVPSGHSDSGIDGSGVYGFNWWRNGRKADGTRKWPGAPPSTYAASGYNNNDLFVIPDWNMTVVRLGLDESEHKITDTEYGQFLEKIGDAITDTTLSGDRIKWHPIALTFHGPDASESDSAPNPFLDFRLQVQFTAPSGHIYSVPGFFHGNGRGAPGNQWQVRFTPDEAGHWTYRTSFRRGDAVAISLSPSAGETTAFDGEQGHFLIAETDPQAPGFHKWGRLEYVGGHYLKFREGGYWLRGGTDSPENLLAYAGFDNTPPSHHFTAHEGDWEPGDPDWNNGRGRAFIGALNALSDAGANSLYALLMNIGGDGGDVFPWIGTPDPAGSHHNDNLHYDLSKLDQWETAFRHAQERGLFLHLVLNEAERANKAELDGGELGIERRLFYREMVARFSHHLALEWNLCEEYNLQLNYGPERIRAFADYLQAIDPYQHPITVHSAGDPLKELAFTFGDPRFSLTSVQLNHRRIDTLVEAFREATQQAGRPLPISMDEFTLDVGQDKSWIPHDRPDLHRKTKLWPTYFSGGMIEFILEGLLDVDSFTTPERRALWQAVGHAQKFMHEHLPFWQMEPADSRVTGEATLTVGRGKGTTFQLGAQVFEQPGLVTAIYFPIATRLGRIDLSTYQGPLALRWFNPRTGHFAGPTHRIAGGFTQSIPAVPSEPAEDWVALIQPRP